MGYYKKTIMLTNDSKDISVLELVRNNMGVFGNLKNYTPIVGDCVLGVCVDGKSIYKQNIICNKSKGYDFKLNSDIDLSSKIGCVLFRQNQSELQPIVWGVNGDIVSYRSKIFNNISSSVCAKPEHTRPINANLDAVNVVKPNNKAVIGGNDMARTNQSTGNFYSANTNHNAKEESQTAAATEQDNIAVTSNIDKFSQADSSNVINSGSSDQQYASQILDAVGNMPNVDIGGVGCRDCDDVIAQAKLFDSSDEEVEADIDHNIVGVESNFYEMISDQIDDLFANYPREENLENLVPSSRWVRVDYDNNGKEYVVGLIYDNQILKYVAYGVPSPNRGEVPEGLEGYSQWLPINPDSADDKGYYVMFQDANTGERIKIN